MADDLQARMPKSLATEWVDRSLGTDPRRPINWHIGHSLASRFAFPELTRLQAEFRRRDARQDRRS